MGAAGYGLVSQGIFRTPYALTRGLGQETDPIASLIGNALGTYQGQKEKQQADQLAARKEKDEEDWRNFQKATMLANAGLTTTPPGGSAATPDSQPQGATTQPHIGAGDRISSPAPAQPVGATPVSSVGGVNLYRAGPSAVEQRDLAKEAHDRQVAINTGHALAGAIGLESPTQPISDDTAEGFGRHPEVFSSWQRFQETPKKDYTPVGEGTGAFNPTTGKVVPTGFTPPQRAEDKPKPAQLQQAEFGAAGLAAWRAVEKERTSNPQVETEVGKVLASPSFVQAIPGFRSAADMVTALQKAGASPAAQRYMRAKWSFMDNIIRTRIPGGRLSGPLFAMAANEFLPSLDTMGNAQMRTNELQAILSAQGESGYDLNPQVWNNATKRHGVSDVDLQAALSGQPSDARMNTIRGKYH